MTQQIQPWQLTQREFAIQKFQAELKKADKILANWRKSKNSKDYSQTRSTRAAISNILIGIMHTGLIAGPAKQILQIVYREHATVVIQAHQQNQPVPQQILIQAQKLLEAS